MKRRFYLHKRGDVYYAELIDPKTGRKLTARSTEKSNRDDAVLVVGDWLRDGLPQRGEVRSRSASDVFAVERIVSDIRELPLIQQDVERIAGALKARGFLASYVVAGTQADELLSAFLLRFWDFEKSPYTAEKKAHGQAITRGHCDKSKARIRLYWNAFLPGKRLGEITREDLKSFSLSLSDPVKALSAATRNRILVAGKTALRWAWENKMISEDVTAGVATFSGEAKKRGILDPDEATALFKLEWPDERAKVGNLVAAMTGLRSGEIRALKLADVGEDRLHVLHSWSDTDGLKSTKNGEDRYVPLLPSVRSRLVALAEGSPYGKEGFIFYGLKADEPMDAYTMLDGLQAALLKLNADTDYWKARNISIHS